LGEKGELKGRGWVPLVWGGLSEKDRPQTGVMGGGGRVGNKKKGTGFLARKKGRGRLRGW